MPGRIIGVSIDANGNRAYRLSLQTREQHIRREKAMSNVCTAQALAGGDGIDVRGFPRTQGPQGHRAAYPPQDRAFGRRAGKGGFKVDPKVFFDTITVDVGPLQAAVMKSAVDEKINLRKVGETRVGITLDECTRPENIEAVWRAFGIFEKDDHFEPNTACRRDMHRKSDYLTHPIFHMNRAETEMMRYMRRLADRDLALDRAMIPLGSCTMKLNSAAEMMPVSWREFSRMHPFVPANQAEGYKELIDDLSAKLCTITGYDGLVDAAQFGRAGRICGSSEHCRLSPRQWRRPPQHLPHSDVGPWHQPGQCDDGRLEGGSGSIQGKRRY